MTDKRLTEQNLGAFSRYLQQEERSRGTIGKYMHDIYEFACWAGHRQVTKELVTQWKTELCNKGYAASSINSMLAALHCFFRFTGWEELRVKYLIVQRRIFCDASRELTREEYERLLTTAYTRGQERLALLMETICSTGIRVSELRYITVETARAGRAEISLKGKRRTILLPGKLCRRLLRYAKKQKTVSGEIFLTRNGTGLSRKQIWAEMKAICSLAGIAPSKVFPHNLRHLFARTFYRVTRDIAKLADLLGHSSIETTRIYLVPAGKEHAKLLERLHLII